MPASVARRDKLRRTSRSPQAKCQHSAIRDVSGQLNAPVRVNRHRTSLRCYHEKLSPPRELMLHVQSSNLGNIPAESSAPALARPARTSRKFVVALLSGIVAAGIVDVGMSQHRPAAATPVAEEQRYDAHGPLDTLPASVLSKFADDADPEIRRRVIDELGRRGSISELVQLLGHPQEDVRSRVPQALLLASEAAHDQIPLLVAALESTDGAGREAAAEALLLLVRTHGPYRGGETLSRRHGACAH